MYYVSSRLKRFIYATDACFNQCVGLFCPDVLCDYMLCGYSLLVLSVFPLTFVQP
jgi:hypothetical protein